MNFTTRPWLAATVFGTALLNAACSSGPLAQGDGPARHFQYLSPDNQVVAEYSTSDAATCQQHLSNMNRINRHGSEATRCGTASAAARLPVTAQARDARANIDYAFRFNSMDQCKRLMGAIAESATVTRGCQ
ncbi:hypothetical protein [Ottowia testudinis]|uniref:Uncharacterized protein n=1 Tax=Ottowia testudinis TaxID=2816950 RepID=A0A975CEV5_9BURK|nr:hypothetical protein [Ottowia testudinis]QTD44259.1 hypothetical protein J1M35_14180 [Ottowia testudinis]